MVDAAAAECSALYRPPELYHLDDPAMVDERVDVWALGCTLYAGMYGDSPFQYALATGGSIPLAVLSGKIKWPADAARQQQAPAVSYPSEMHDCVTWMLNADPRARPSSADVAARLRAMLDSPPWLQTAKPGEWTPQFDEAPLPLPPKQL